MRKSASAMRKFHGNQYTKLGGTVGASAPSTFGRRAAHRAARGAAKRTALLLSRHK